MKDYIKYKNKTALEFNKLIKASGGAIFDCYRQQAVQFNKYVNTDFDIKLSEYYNVIDIDAIKLENVFPTKYRWLVASASLKDLTAYIINLNARLTEFETKEYPLKVLVNTLFLRYVFLTKLIDIYLQYIYMVKKDNTDADITKIKLEDVGIGKEVLRHLDGLEDIGQKKIDDWLQKFDKNNIKQSPFEYTKRMLKIIADNETLVS